jgi:hypothetical protein
MWRRSWYICFTHTKTEEITPEMVQHHDPTLVSGVREAQPTFITQFLFGSVTLESHIIYRSFNLIISKVGIIKLPASWGCSELGRYGMGPFSTLLSIQEMFKHWVVTKSFSTRLYPLPMLKCEVSLHWNVKSQLHNPLVYTNILPASGILRSSISTCFYFVR